jgi:hypothetical protein
MSSLPISMGLARQRGGKVVIQPDSRLFPRSRKCDKRRETWHIEPCPLRLSSTRKGGHGGSQGALPGVEALGHTEGDAAFVMREFVRTHGHLA